MKKKKMLFILVLTMVCLISLTTLQTYATSNTTITETEYSYSNIPTEKAEKMISEMSGESNLTGGNAVSTYNILCIFGHSIQIGGIFQTEHNYYSTAPHCKETTSLVEYCSRSNCDYFKVTDQFVSRRSCH